MTWLYRKLLGWLQRKCDHPSQRVTADILEGCGHGRMGWCRICGAYRWNRGEWREPRADWWK